MALANCLRLAQPASSAIVASRDSTNTRTFSDLALPEPAFDPFWTAMVRQICRRAYSARLSFANSRALRSGIDLSVKCLRGLPHIGQLHGVGVSTTIADFLDSFALPPQYVARDFLSLTLWWILIARISRF